MDTGLVLINFPFACRSLLELLATNERQAEAILAVNF